MRNQHIGPVSFAVGAGACALISGPSGAGKSLLLRAIADLDPHEGEVYLDGMPARRLQPGHWRRQVALLPAETAWWADRVGDHFAETNADALQALGFGPDVMDWEVLRLSSGERQRLGLLRLLANEPKALLLDEPTASLDPHSVSQVERLLDAYRDTRRAAVVWVSHDVAQLERLRGRHYRLEAGVLKTEGT